MSSVDVGDAVELTFTTAAGATVTASWFGPGVAPAFEDQPVAEAGPGEFPHTFVPTAAGTWTARFTATGAATNVEEYYVRASAVGGLAPLATVGDVADQEPLSAAQQALAGRLVKAASQMIRSRFPAIDAHIAGGLLDPEAVALGVTNMVLRVLRNPKGLRGQSVGPFSYTYDVPTASRATTGILAATAGQLVITQAEEAIFTPVLLAQTAAFGVGTIVVRAGLPGSPFQLGGRPLGGQVELEGPGLTGGADCG